MKFMGHLSHMGEKRNAYRVFMGKLEGNDHFKQLDTDGSIILKLDLK